MTKKTLKISACFWLMFALFSCENDSGTDFPDAIGVKGRVNVQNEFQQPLYSERSGISVLLETGFLSYTVQADNQGNWKLDNAPIGTYTVTYSKAGFSTVFDTDLRLSTVDPDYAIENGYQKFPSVSLTKLPDTQFVNFNLDLAFVPVGVDTVYSLNVSAEMVPAPPPTGQARGYRLFLGDDPLVSPENFLYQNHYNTLNSNISRTFNNDWFDSLDFSSGDAIYAAIYGDANFDQALQKGDSSLVFPNISASAGAVASVVLP